MILAPASKRISANESLIALFKQKPGANRPDLGWDLPTAAQRLKRMAGRSARRQAITESEPGWSLSCRSAGHPHKGDCMMDGHILVIDDDANSRQLLSGILEHLGLSVSTAGNGAEGLEVIQRQ